jgi:hypothetical protein
MQCRVSESSRANVLDEIRQQGSAKGFILMNLLGRLKVSCGGLTIAGTYQDEIDCIHTIVIGMPRCFLSYKPDIVCETNLNFCVEKMSSVPVQQNLCQMCSFCVIARVKRTRECTKQCCIMDVVSDDDDDLESLQLRIDLLARTGRPVSSKTMDGLVRQVQACLGVHATPEGLRPIVELMLNQSREQQQRQQQEQQGVPN